MTLVMKKPQSSSYAAARATLFDASVGSMGLMTVRDEGAGRGSWAGVPYSASPATTPSRSEQSLAELLESARMAPADAKARRMLKRRLAWPEAFDAALVEAIAPSSGMRAYAAELPNARALELTARLLAYLGRDFAPDTVGVAADGGMGVAWTRDGWYADIECLNCGEVLMVHRLRNGENTLVEIDPADFDRDTAGGALSIAEVLRGYGA